MHRRRMIWRLIGNERGSQSLEAAGAALAAMSIVFLLLSGADVLGNAVQQGYQCAASAINGGGGGCGSGGGSAPAVNASAANAPAANAALPPAQQSRRSFGFILASLNPFSMPAAQAQPALFQRAVSQSSATANQANAARQQRVAQTQPQANRGNAILDDLQTNGAQRTARQDNLNITGVAASRQMAQTDQQRVAQYAPIFREVGAQYGLPPAVLAGIASRETRGRPVGSNNFAGAWGLMQVLNGADCNCAADSREHIDQAAGILRTKLNEVRAAHPDWTEAQQLRGAIAAYNFGSGNVRTLERLDVGTDNDDYSADVWARAQYYAQDEAFAAQPGGAITNGRYRPAPSLADVEAGRAQILPGMQGPAVAELQRRLGIEDDGKYGPKTQAAVERFQRENSLRPRISGAVGPATMARLAEQPPAPSGSTAELAQRLLDNRNIVQEGNRNRNDGSNPLDNLRSAAQGQDARTSRDVANATRRTAPVNPNLLRGLDSLASRYRIGVSAITGGGHGNNSHHYSGDAVDIATVNGRAVQNMSAAEIAEFSRAIRALPGFRGYLGPDRNDGNHGDHFHITFNR